ncbi:MAG: RNA polymerase sigma factor [Pseudomonadota bacterium]
MAIDQNGSPDGQSLHDRSESFGLLYRECAPRLRRQIRSRVGSDDEARDLVQDAFTRLLGARPAEGFRAPGAFLNRIVHNLLVDRSRRLSARPLHVAFDAETGPSVAPEQAEIIELDQMRRRYRNVVETLPPRMRQVFILHRIDELSYKQIAAHLDISVRTVEWHIAEAIVRISRALDAE